MVPGSIPGGRICSCLDACRNFSICSKRFVRDELDQRTTIISCLWLHTENIQAERILSSSCDQKASEVY